MRRLAEVLKDKLGFNSTYLQARALPYALRLEIRAFRRWLRKYPGYIAALVLIVAVALFGWTFFVMEEKKRVERLRLQVGAQNRVYQEKLERKQQRLAIVLSHLEDNPELKTPGNKQLIVGPFAKLGWEYCTKDKGACPYSDKHSVKHSIVEIRNAETPLESKRTLITGEAAWYPISFEEKLDRPGKYLWRVIPADIDSSGNIRAEGNWGPYSVFAIYPSVYERIKATKKIRIGSYNVEQVRLGNEDSKIKEHCEDDSARIDDSTGLSDSDSKLLCDVIMSSSILEKFGKLKPLVKRYSNIDDKLLVDLMTGELDIAFGNVSNASYRREKGFSFVEYKTSEPMLLTNKHSKGGAERMAPMEKICTFQGTVYEHVLEKLRYDFAECQNIYDAIYQLYRKDIQGVLMSKETWKTINNPDVTEAFDPDKEPKLLAHVKNELEGDAFAMLDKALYEDICEVLEIMQKDDSLRNKHNLQHVQCSARSN